MNKARSNLARFDLARFDLPDSKAIKNLYIWKIAKYMKMHYRIITTILSCFLAINLFGQVPTCEQGRYEIDIFNSVLSTIGLSYGSGETVGGVQKDLLLDVFEPVGDDPSVRRPVIILAFGGSFIGGAREDVHFLCEAYARKGYVTVAIDYRLYDLPLLPLPTAEAMTEVVIRTVSDMKAAIRYMREDADTNDNFKIDPSLIFLGGISAGAITAAHTVFLDETDPLSADIVASIEANGGFEGNTSDNFQYSSETQGLINLSGGLISADLVTSDDPPLFSVHDEFDQTVPYAGGFATVLGQEIIFMEGSKLLHDAADILDIDNELITIAGSTIHVSYLFSDAEIRDIVDASATFIKEIACGTISSNEDLEAQSGFEVYPNPCQDQLFINNKNNAAHQVVVYDGAGRILIKQTNVELLDISSLESGRYYVELKDLNTGTFETKAIFKLN